MSSFKKCKIKLKWKYFRLAAKAKRVTLPGFDSVPLYDVGVFFINGLYNGAISLRASAIAYSFFLALFPAIIFLFTLIPYIPIDNFQVELLRMISGIMPNNAYSAIQTTIEDIAMHKRGGLLSFGFLASLIFSTNGIAAMISAFNGTVNSFENRNWFSIRFISVILVLILTSLITIAISLITFSRTFLNYLVSIGFLKDNITYYLIYFGQFIIIITLFFIAISFLYYLAPAKKTKWKFISAGATLATLLSIIISFIFSFYINHFGRYNTLYGSIGTIIVILVMFYINALVLIIGFELNAGIKNAKLERIKPFFHHKKTRSHKLVN
ncbi:MAG: YihY/virulence factor BrkB family protein [Bacteroidetes bacterium]|nr:YihY/virulence factor BrkB family protein [Bacteroidota bacterium]